MKPARWLYCALGVLVTAYLVQMVSPLRLDNDSVVNLRAALLIVDHAPATGNVPLGYPLAIAALYRAGLGTAQGLFALNFAFVAIGIVSTWWMARETGTATRLWVAMLTLLSYPVLRATILAQADAMGFGLSLLVIAILTSVSGERIPRNALLLALAIVLTVIASTVRMATVALVIPILWCIMRIVAPRNASEVKMAVAAATLLLGGILAALVIAEDGTFARYRQEIGQSVASRTPLRFIEYRVNSMLRGIGELSVNLPVSRFWTARRWMWLAGLIPTWFFVRTARSAGLNPVITVFIVSHLVMLAVWPFFTTRLWLPLIPLLALHLVVVWKALPADGWRRAALRGFVAWFIFTGSLALLYSTRISFSGEAFRSRWGNNGGFANRGHEGGDHNRNALMVIKRFDAGNPAWATLLSGEESVAVPRTERPLIPR